jgi:hypothetical protein
MPDQDAALAITAETSDMQEEINLVWQYLLPAFKENKLPANTDAQTRLNKKIKSLALPAPPMNAEPFKAGIMYKTYAAAENPMHLKGLTFNFSHNVCNATFTTTTAAYKISFASGKWQYGETNMPGPSFTASSIENNSVVYPAKIMGSYTWVDANTLKLVLRYIESPHTETYTCHFHDNVLTVDAERSFDYGKNKTVIEFN